MLFLRLTIIAKVGSYTLSGPSYAVHRVYLALRCLYRGLLTQHRSENRNG